LSNRNFNVFYIFGFCDTSGINSADTPSDNLLFLSQKAVKHQFATVEALPP